MGLRQAVPWRRLTDLTARISAEKLAAKVGRTLDVIIDEVELDPPRDGEGDRSREDGNGGGGRATRANLGATGRSKADAPEIDGNVHLRDAGHLTSGDIVRVHIEDSDEHDLFGVPVA